jgi:hypothetical protein
LNIDNKIDFLIIKIPFLIIPLHRLEWIIKTEPGIQPFSMFFQLWNLFYQHFRFYFQLRTNYFQLSVIYFQLCTSYFQLSVIYHQLCPIYFQLQHQLSYQPALPETPPFDTFFINNIRSRLMFDILTSST